MRPTTWILLAGCLFLLLFVTETSFLHGQVPHRGFYNTSLLFLSTIFLTGCAFFSLREFFCRTDFRREHFLQTLLAGMLIFTLFYSEQAKFLTVYKTISKFDNRQNFLPEIVEKARTSEDPKYRESFARFAYIFNGARISYRDANNNWTYYDPPAQEVADRQKADSLETSLKNLRITSLGLFEGGIDVVASMFFTLLVCLMWAAFRKNEEKAASQSPH